MEEIVKGVKVIKEVNTMGHVWKLCIVDGEYETYIDGNHIDRFKLLSFALNAENEKSAWMILNEASKLYHPRDDSTFNSLYSAVAETIARKYEKNEFTYQRLFKKNCEKCGFGRIVNYKDDGKNIPDAWVEKDGELIPVEAKFLNFNGKALKQLQRYMSVYGTKHGYAVAQDLTVNLPDSITFIPFSVFCEGAE